jgi:hypothetical protein
MSSHGDMHGEQALLGAAVAAGSTYGSGYVGNGVIGKDIAAYGATSAHNAFVAGLEQSLLNDSISTAANVLGQYGARQAWGADHSSYDQMNHVDLSRLASLGFGMYVAGEQSEGKYTEAQQQYTLALALAKDANDRSKQEQAKWILMGLGYREEKVQKFLADAAKQTAVRKAEIETNAYLVCGTLVANGELSNNEKFEDAKLLLQQLAGDGPITPEIIHAAAAYLSRDGANIKFNMQGAANGAQTLVGIDQVKTLNSNLVAQLKAGLTVPTSLAPNTQFTIDGVLVQTDSHGKATMMVDVTDIQPARSSAVDYDDQHAEMWGAELDAPRPKGLMERFRDWSGITTLKQSIAMELSNLPPTLRPGAEDSYREDFGRNRQKVRDGIITQAEFNAWRDRMIAQDPTRPSFPVNSDAGLIGYLGFGGLGSQAAVVGENGLQVFGKPLSVVKDEIRGLQAAGVDKATIVDYLRTGRFPTSPGWTGRERWRCCRRVDGGGVEVD